MIKKHLLPHSEKRIADSHSVDLGVAHSDIERGCSIPVSNDSSAKKDILKIGPFRWALWQESSLKDNGGSGVVACVRVEPEGHGIVVSIFVFIKSGDMSQNADTSVRKNVDFVCPAPFVG